jgi:hypothetical protein
LSQKLSVQDLFLGELFQAMIFLARGQEAGHSVLCIYLITSPFIRALRIPTSVISQTSPDIHP